MVNILIIKTSAFGDIVQLFPAIQFLKQIAPACRIDWVVEERCSSLVTAHPLVDQALCIHSRKWGKQLLSLQPWLEMRAFKNTLRAKTYDVVFDFQGNIKSGLIIKLARSCDKVGFGKRSVSERPNLLFTHTHIDPIPGRNVRWDYMALVEAWSGRKADALQLTRLKLTADEALELQKLVLKKSSKRNLMICPGSNWPNKQLPEADLKAFLTHIDTLIDCKFWFVGGTKEECALCARLATGVKEGSVCDLMPLPLLQHWMGEMDQVIAMDSLALHLAGEAGTATFSLFGPSIADKFGPPGDNHASFQGRCPYGQTFDRRCPILRSCSTGACIRNPNLEKIIQSYLTSLSSSLK